MLSIENYDLGSSSQMKHHFITSTPYYQWIGEDELFHIISHLQDGLLAFALVCTAFRNAVHHYLGSVHIESTCAQVICPQYLEVRLVSV